jgi:hypothetical protein
MLIKKVHSRLDRSIEAWKGLPYMYSIGGLTFSVRPLKFFVEIWAMCDNVGGSNTLVARLPYGKGIVATCKKAMKIAYVQSPATQDEINELIAEKGIDYVKELYLGDVEKYETE